MIDAIETYLRELDQLLSKRIPETRRSEIVAEVRGHFGVAMKEMVGQGLSEEQAGQRAVEQMGSMRALAHELIRQHTGINSKPAWKIAKTSIAILLLAFAFELGILFFPYSSNMADISLLLQGALLLSLGTFCVAVVRSRRWLVRPFGGVFLGFSMFAAIVLSGFWTGLVGSPASIAAQTNRSTAISNQQTTRQHLRADFDYANRALQAVRSGTPIPLQGKTVLQPFVTSFQTREMIWGFSVPTTSTLETAALYPAADAQNVASSWRSLGDRVVALLNLKLSEEQYDNGLAHLSGWQYFGFALRRTLWSSGLHLVVLGVLNGLLLLVANAYWHRMAGRRGREASRAG